jgi:hypothetical protein
MARFRTRAIAFCLLASALGGTAAKADEQDFLNRFDGTWSGGGQVRRNAQSPVWNVRCTVAGDRAAIRMAIDGRCRGAIVVTREIGARIRYDAATGLYSGTYVGARVGPAAISGRRAGDRVTFTILWPKPVNGSTRAQMTIDNDGRGTLKIQVISRPTEGGPATTLSNLVFSKS